MTDEKLDAKNAPNPKLEDKPQPAPPPPPTPQSVQVQGLKSTLSQGGDSTQTDSGDK